MPPVAQSTIDQMVRQAEGLAGSGRLREAAQILREATTLAPRHSMAHATLGWVYGQLGEHHRGVEPLRKAVALDGTRAENHYYLGTILQVTGPVPEALVCFQRAMALKPSLPGPYGGAASVLERSSQPDKARQVIEKGLKAVPRDAQLKAIHAGMRLRDGEAEGARDDLRALLASRPEPDLQARIRAWHTLGQVLDKLADADGSFEAYTSCNRLRELLPQVKWALENDNVTPMIHAQAAITREHFVRWAAEEPDDGLPTPAFLVGCPRSGTTMLEQVLGSHPACVSTPERGMLLHPVAIVEHAQRLNPSRPLVDIFDSMTKDEVTTMRRRYWDAAKPEIGGELNGRLLVDKYPVHVGRLGLINRIFPRARVLVALRDPRDCCLSAYTQYFAHNPAMVRFLRLDTTARFYADLLGSFLTLKNRLTTPLMTARYEDTVEDLEAQARKMLEFLGLEWNDAVLRPEDRAKKRYVNTPSWQSVNTGVNTRARGRWVKFRKHLEPILPVLEPFVKEFGYETSYPQGSDSVAPGGSR
jgi:Flp pilus assembly protein TadD